LARKNMKKQVLTAFFPGRAQADSALAELGSLGVLPDEISVIPKNVAHAEDLGIRAATKASEGAAIGAIAGGLLGALTGAMAAAGAIVVPAAGSVLAGPVVAALSGAGAFGALGVVVGALLGARVPEFEARLLEDAVNMGGSLVAVRVAPGLIDRIERVLESQGGCLVRRTAAER
jgi:hypothetical protein